MSKHLPTFIVVLLLILGLSMLFYPDIASWWNGRSQRGMVLVYDEEVSRLSQEIINAQFRRAAEVNAELSELADGAPLLIAHLAAVPDDYEDILNVSGIMARVEIPVIGVNLPIFHTTQARALDRGVGHLEGTAFPIGGYSTHSVLTAHTGLANARMFSDMEGNVGIGDRFFIQVLGQRLAYEVDQILTILPHEIESLRVIQGQDLVTLITCTPYAVNSHRLLVRGRRIEYIPYMAEEIEQAIIATRVDIRIFIFVGLFLMFMITFGIYSAVKGRESHNPPTRKPVRLGQPVYEATNPEKHHKSPFEDLFNDLASRPKQSPKALKPALINNFASDKRKSAKKPMPNMKKNIFACFIVLTIILGGSVAVAQALGQPGSRGNGQNAITDFVSRIDDYKADYMDRWVAERLGRWLDSGELDVLGPTDGDPLLWLHQLITEHNRNLYDSGQGSLPDPFDYSQENFNLSRFGFTDEEMIGFVTIPSIDIELPVFMGASRENLHRGLAHVTNTSLPVGGTNTNAVIAGYMDLRRTSLLDNISEISIGDEIQVTNFYETIIYTVAYIHQREYTPAETLTIQSDRDLLTLIGYRQGNQQRYTVVAKRSH